MAHDDDSLSPAEAATLKTELRMTRSEVSGLRGDLQKMGEAFAQAAIQSAVVLQRLDSAEKRIKAIEGWGKWVVAIVGAAIIMALLGSIFIGTQAPTSVVK